MGRTVFITFGGPAPDYHNAVTRICNEAAQFNVFDNIVGKTDIDLKRDTAFWPTHDIFIKNNPRGYGYWLWKSYIIKKQLEIMEDNDVLVYADAGCVLNIQGKPRLLEYIQLANHDSGIVSFQMNLLEQVWTKMDIIIELNGQDLLTTGHICATSFIIRKCPNSIKCVNLWYDTCCKYNLINDSPSKIPNHPDFRQHRHDQSIWSIIRKKYGCVFLTDETWHNNFQNDGINFPIWAMRKRHG